MRLADMLSGAKPFSVEVAWPDLLNGGWRNILQTYSTKPGPKVSGDFLIDDAFRRGFIIATGLCEGMSERDPGQTAVYQSLAEKGGRAGFDAGQAVAWWRTKREGEELKVKLKVSEALHIVDLGRTRIRESLNDQAKVRFDASKKLHLGLSPLKRTKGNGNIP